MREMMLPIMVGLASTLATTALADDSPGTDKGQEMFIEFGASMAEWAVNRLCDDPRFMNAAGRADSRMSSPLDPDALFQDADDCRAAFIEGHIIPRMVFGDVSFASDLQYTETRDSRFRYIGDCSDPRLEGEGIIKQETVATVLGVTDASSKAIELPSLPSAPELTFRRVTAPAAFNSRADWNTDGHNPCPTTSRKPVNANRGEDAAARHPVRLRG